MVDKKEYLFSVTTPYETFVTAHLQKNQGQDQDQKKLCRRRKKYITTYLKKFHEMLKDCQNQGKNEQQALHCTNATDTTNTHNHSISSMGNTTTGESMMQESSIKNGYSILSQQPTEMASTTMPTASSDTASSDKENVGTLNLGICSPISVHSEHNLDMNNASISMCTDDECNFDYYSMLWLKNLDSSFTFGESPALTAKPFHTFTDQDLKLVQSMGSFLYLVFRNPNLFEVPFFKVRYILYS